VIALAVPTVIDACISMVGYSMRPTSQAVACAVERVHVVSPGTANGISQVAVGLASAPLAEIGEIVTCRVALPWPVSRVVAVQPQLVAHSWPVLL